MPLSEIAVKKLKPKEKRYLIADERGLYIEVYPNGTKAWRFRQFSGGKQTKISLGTYPEITLAEARNICEEMRRKAAHGENLKDGKEQGLTFALIAQEWLETRIRPDKALTYIEGIEQKLKNHILPAIGDKQISEITPSVVLGMCRKIEALGIIETAVRCKQIVGQVFKFAISTDQTDIEPTGALSGALKTRKHKHFAALTDPARITNLMQQIRVYPFTIVRCALMFSVLTFARPGEVRHAEWSEIDLDEKEWRIPAGKMKMKRVHIVLLSSQLLQSLQELKLITGNQKWLFPSTRRDGKSMSENTVRMALRTMGFAQEEVTPHGFRGMASTILYENGFQREHIEMQLAHAPKDKVSAAYNHAEYLPQRREMMQWYADYLDSLK